MHHHTAEVLAANDSLGILGMGPASASDPPPERGSVAGLKGAMWWSSSEKRLEALLLCSFSEMFEGEYTIYVSFLYLT